MRRSFEKVKQLKLTPGLARDPRFIVRAILGLLLLANLIAAWAVFRPVGGSAEDLNTQLLSMRQQMVQRQAALKRLRLLASKMDHAREAGDSFLNGYFMARHTASSTILSELVKAAKDSGIKPKGDAFTFEPVDGSDTISMMTIAANYEGTYPDLLHFVNRLDRSQRFLILENLAAAPQLNGGALNVSIKLNTFVREDQAAQ